MQSKDTTLQPQHVMSPTAASGHSSVDQQVMDQFTQMRTMLSSFLGQKQEITTCAVFCNYLAMEVEGLEEKYFQTFRNKGVKPRSSSATSTFVSQIFQQLQQPATSARKYIFTIPDTQVLSSQVIQLTQQSQVASKGQQQQSRGQPTSFVVVDNQQAGPSRPFTFTLTRMKHFSPPSVASGEESQHNISGVSSFFRNLHSLMCYKQIETS